MQGLGVTALCVPAREVGGDYYDFFPLGPGRLGVQFIRVQADDLLHDFVRLWLRSPSDGWCRNLEGRGQASPTSTAATG